MKKNLTVKTVDQLTALLNLVAEASVKEVMSELSGEKAAQAQVSSELEDYRAPEGSDDEEELDDEEVEEVEDEEADDKKPKKDLTKLGSANPNPEKPSVPDGQEVVGADLGGVVKSLNKIRSGKSLKDEMTKRELNDYLKNLSDGERQSLYVFLDGLSQIMAGGVAGDQAPDPGAVGITVNATTKIKEPTKSRPAATPASIAKSKNSSGTPGEPQPIIVGESADKSNVRKRFHMLVRD